MRNDIDQKTVVVTFDKQEAIAAVEALNAAAAEHEDRGRTHVAEAVREKRDAIEAAITAFDGFSARMAITNAREIFNDVSYGIRRGRDDLPHAARDARRVVNEAINGVESDE